MPTDRARPSPGESNRSRGRRAHAGPSGAARLARRPLALLAVLLMACGVALIAAPEARAESPVLSNSDLGDYYGNSPVAQSFTTGPEAVTLAELRMRAGWSMLGTLTAEIRNDNQGPGTTHCTLEPAEQYYHLPVTHSFVSDSCDLAADTTYWVLVNAHNLDTDDSVRRRVHQLASGSMSSYGWSFGEARYWNYGSRRWETNTPSPWMEIIPETLPSVVPPSPPAASSAPVDTRSAECLARKRAVEREYPPPFYSVIVHCD